MNNRPWGRIKIRNARDRAKVEILRRHNLTEVRHGGKLVIEARPYSLPTGAVKTALMRQIEARFGEDITVLLMGGTEQAVADKLGIKRVTVSCWRLRLGLRGKSTARVRPAKSRKFPGQSATNAKGDNREGGTTRGV